MPFDDPYEEEKEDEIVTIESIGDMLILAADKIIKYQIRLAMGALKEGDTLDGGSKDYQEKVLAYVKPMIKDYQQAKNISAKSANQVIGLLSKGKIKPSEALALLKVVRERIKAEEEEMMMKIKKELVEHVDKEDEVKVIAKICKKCGSAFPLLETSDQTYCEECIKGEKEWDELIAEQKELPEKENSQDGSEKTSASNSSQNETSSKSDTEEAT